MIRVTLTIVESVNEDLEPCTAREARVLIERASSAGIVEREDVFMVRCNERGGLEYEVSGLLEAAAKTVWLSFDGALVPRHK